MQAGITFDLVFTLLIKMTSKVPSLGSVVVSYQLSFLASALSVSEPVILGIWLQQLEF